ncbi:hypothetical protein Hanom_Chr17g01591251 [Helianthus anomalus]
MRDAVATVNNAIRAVGLNTGVHGGYLHVLQKKNPFGDVPLLTKDADKKLDAAIAHFDSLRLPLIESLVASADEPLPRIQETLGFVAKRTKNDD